MAHTKELTMTAVTKREPHPTRVDEAEQNSDPGMLPVAPDQGPVPAVIPADPEHDRVVDPEA